MQNLNDNIPELKIEFMTDGTGDGLILLEQDSCGNADRLAIHPIHLRYMAEKMGLIETSDPTAHKTIATLTRRLHLLRDRIDHLGDYLANHSDSKHADLFYEMTYARATADIADEFCAEFECVAPEENTPENGAVEHPQKRGALKPTECSPAPTHAAQPALL